MGIAKKEHLITSVRDKIIDNNSDELDIIFNVCSDK